MFITLYVRYITHLRFKLSYACGTGSNKVDQDFQARIRLAHYRARTMKTTIDELFIFEENSTNLE